jgi:hypothetical protein
LSYFEDNYWDLVLADAGTYGWYQGQFGRRAREVFDRKGVEFILFLKNKLPWERFEEWTSTELLVWLDAIEPGFEV